MVIDSHVHIYPDAIAQKAALSIGEFYHIPMQMDGTVGTLLAQENKAGIDRQLVHSVAVTPSRVDSVNRFIIKSCAENPSFIGFATMHPAYEGMEDALAQAKAQGLCGVKLHPDFQKFYLDEEASLRMFSVFAKLNLPALIHTGDYRYPFSEPKRMLRVLEQVPNLRVICAHLGGWSVWKDAWKTLAGHPSVWVDTSSSLYQLSKEEAAFCIRQYGVNRVFFGTDYPMWKPEEERARLEALPLTKGEKEAILGDNLASFLHLS